MTQIDTQAIYGEQRLHVAPLRLGTKTRQALADRHTGAAFDQACAKVHLSAIRGALRHGARGVRVEIETMDLAQLVAVNLQPQEWQRVTLLVNGQPLDSAAALVRREELQIAARPHRKPLPKLEDLLNSQVWKQYQGRAEQDASWQTKTTRVADKPIQPKTPAAIPATPPPVSVATAPPPIEPVAEAEAESTADDYYITDDTNHDHRPDSGQRRPAAGVA